MFNNIQYFESLESTNDYLKKEIFTDNLIVYTFNQTKGRGREGRVWLNFNGKNVALSVGIRQKEEYKNIFWYTALASVVLCKILKKYKIKNLWIKWPNDIYVGKKKIAGILTESVWLNNKLVKIIIGIGLNVNSNEYELNLVEGNTATSIFCESGVLADLNKLVIKFVEYFSIWYTNLCKKNGIEKLRKYWLNKSKIIGHKVQWINNDKIILGKVKNIDQDGILYLESESQVFKVLSGEVKLTSFTF